MAPVPSPLLKHLKRWSGLAAKEPYSCKTPREAAFSALNRASIGFRNVKVELYGFSTIHYNCRSRPKHQVQLDPLEPLRFKLRSKAVVEYRSNHNLRLIAEGLDAAFEPSHRSARRVEAGSYHHERRARRRADGHADALPRRGLCRLAGNTGSAFRRPAEDRSRHERLQRGPHQARRSAKANRHQRGKHRADRSRASRSAGKGKLRHARSV